MHSTSDQEIRINYPVQTILSSRSVAQVRQAQQSTTPQEGTKSHCYLRGAALILGQCSGCSISTPGEVLDASRRKLVSRGEGTTALLPDRHQMSSNISHWSLLASTAREARRKLQFHRVLQTVVNRPRAPSARMPTSCTFRLHDNQLICCSRVMTLLACPLKPVAPCSSSAYYSNALTRRTRVSEDERSVQIPFHDLGV